MLFRYSLILLLLTSVSISRKVQRHIETPAEALEHHTSLFPVLPKFIIYCTEQDYAWTLFSGCIFDLFDQNQDQVIESSEWSSTVSGITGSQTIADWSLVIYYGIVAGTFEWRMDIQEDDWTDFMDLVRDYLEENINENNNGNLTVSGSSQTTSSNQTVSSNVISSSGSATQVSNQTNTQNSTGSLVNLRKNVNEISVKGFCEQLKRKDPKIMMRHQALGDYICDNTQYWGILVTFLFNFYDVNQDGFIEESELVEISNECGFNLPLMNYWQYIDTNKDGKLDQAEWANAMSYAKVYIQPQLDNIIPNINFEQLLKSIF